MKIAIQGHLTRGHEVIQILESLGGKNKERLKGSKEYWYFINSDGYIRNDYKSVLQYKGFKTYTLEEFEKEFPFKIGDIILLKGVNKPCEIIALELYMNKLCYKLDNGLHYAPETLTTYEKMKEKRNITLTFEKAKEWYNKGGELREIALQVFTEKELNPFPKSWEEFCKQGNSIVSWKHMIPIKYEALFKLEQLRNCWIQDWEPDWNDVKQAKFCVCYYQGKFKITTLYETRHFLSFPTYDLALKFLECFKDLIETAGDLI